VSRVTRLVRCVPFADIPLILATHFAPFPLSTDWGAFQSILPFPIVALAPSNASTLSDVQIRIAPDATSITRNLGSRYLASYGIDDFASASLSLLILVRRRRVKDPADLFSFSPSQYNGALVTEINGAPATDYVKFVADTVTGTYLDLVSAEPYSRLYLEVILTRLRSLFAKGVRTNSVFVRIFPSVSSKC
jgi:hypothetical protein